MVLATNVLTPTSRKSRYLIAPTLLNAEFTGGSITLASTNPFDQPNIDPALLNSDFDIFTMREGIKAALRFVAAPAWKDYVIEPYSALAEAKTDAQIEEYARNNSGTVFHPFSTASMSPKGCSYGVVNPDFTVKNTIGLRIVDASVLVRWFFRYATTCVFDVVARPGRTTPLLCRVTNPLKPAPPRLHTVAQVPLPHAFAASHHTNHPHKARQSLVATTCDDELFF